MFIIFIGIVAISSGNKSSMTVSNSWLGKLKSYYVNSCHVTFSFSVASQLQKQGKELNSADMTKVSQKSYDYCNCLADEVEYRNVVDVSSAYFNSIDDNSLPGNISKVESFISSSDGELISDKCISYSF